MSADIRKKFFSGKPITLSEALRGNKNSDIKNSKNLKKKESHLIKKAESLKFIDKSKLNYRRIMSFETDFTEKSEKEELELVKTYD